MEYHIWNSMIGRCHRTSHKQFPDYGGRGIMVCDRWHAFENFLSDMGERPRGMWLERIDNDKGYDPDNCCWATPRQQARNRRNNRPITINGKTLLMIEWAEHNGLSYRLVKNRIRRGWSPEDAVSMPLQSKGYRYSFPVPS